jgi:hypothetical protein
MRKMLVVILVGSLLLTALPAAAQAGDSHAVSNRWAGVGIAAAAITVGGLLLGAFQTPAVAAQPPAVVYNQPPVVYAPPPVVYSQPPVVYAPPPVVYAPAPVVVYSPPPVVVHRDWGPHGYGRPYHR